MGTQGVDYLTMIVGIFIFLGVLTLIHGLIVLLHPERQKEKKSQKGRE
ncbi:MAG: hypothetical protein ACFFDX_15920 [Candidatus Odinarchaeota archaeon]